MGHERKTLMLNLINVECNVEYVDLIDCVNMLENINAKTCTVNDMQYGNKRLGFIAQDVKAYLPDTFDNIIGCYTITGE